jgi:hypothetical protein
MISSNYPRALLTLCPVTLRSCNGWQMKGPESFLPKDLLSCAGKRGNEYAWRKQHLLAVAEAAEHSALASDGWQVQFRTPDGECELCWTHFDPEERRKSESWSEYVARSWQESRLMWQKLFDNAKLVEEGRKIFQLIQQTEGKGVLPRDSLWFVLYFRSETEFRQGMRERKAPR